MKVFTIASIKGGVGKTALVSFLAQAARRRILVIDSDANNNLTDYYLRHRTFEEINARNLFHVLTRELSINDCIFNTDYENIDIIPCTLQLARIGIELYGDPGASIAFKKALELLNYELVLIDTPPALNWELRNALFISDVILTPINLTRWTVQALILLQEELKAIRETLGRDPLALGVPSIVTEKEALQLRDFDFNMTRGFIRKTAAVKNALDYSRPLKPDSKAGNDFNLLWREIWKKANV